jgi:glycosidase
MGVPPETALSIVKPLTRDKCRTPMQWANMPNGGFSPEGVRTWLPVNPNYTEGVNVAEQASDPKSLLSAYKNMLQVRKNTPALIAGDYQALHEEAEAYFAFLRRTGEQTCLVVLNYTNQEHWLSFDMESQAGSLIFSSRERNHSIDLNALNLSPYEVLIVEL